MKEIEQHFVPVDTFWHITPRLEISLDVMTLAFCKVKHGFHSATKMSYLYRLTHINTLILLEFTTSDCKLGVKTVFIDAHGVA